MDVANMSATTAIDDSFPTRPPLSTVGVLQSIGVFLLSGVCEIAGGWLVWQTLRERGAVWQSEAQAFVGSVFLVAYGMVATLQPESFDFGRVYAAYGGVFIGMSMAWGIWVDKSLVVDTGDIIGVTASLAGAALICFWPRSQ